MLYEMDITYRHENYLGVTKAHGKLLKGVETYRVTEKFSLRINDTPLFLQPDNRNQLNGFAILPRIHRLIMEKLAF